MPPNSLLPPEPDSDPVLRPLGERLTQMGKAWRGRPLTTDAIVGYLRTLTHEERHSASPYPLQEEYDFMDSPTTTAVATRPRRREWIIIPLAAALLVAVLGVAIFVTHGRTQHLTPSTTTLMPTPQALTISDIHTFSTGQYGVTALTMGPDGSIWYTAYYDDGKHPETRALVHITVNGEQSYFPIPNSASTSTEIVSVGKPIFGPDGALWFSISRMSLIGNGNASAQIGRMSLTGQYSQFTVTLPASRISSTSQYVTQLVLGPDGNIWFTANKAPLSDIIGYIGRMTLSGAVTWVYSSVNGIDGMTFGPDKTLWFTDGRQIGHRATNGSVSYIPLKPTPYDLTFDAKGTLWFAGLDEQQHLFVGHYQPHTRTLVYFSLPNATVATDDIVFDQHNGVWINTVFANGTPRIPQSHLYHISAANDLTIVTLSHLNYTVPLTQGPNGTLWFGAYQNVGTASSPNYLNFIGYFTP
jgi:streptogramin lyase